jgi:Fe-S oxidoreductase
VLHGHCHQKALWGSESSAALLRRLVGDRLTVLDSGCCGMAGSFGYTADHYDVSMKIGELSLFPAVRGAAGATVVAPGTSCRHQIHDGTGVRALHPMELLDRMLSGQALAAL